MIKFTEEQLEKYMEENQIFPYKITDIKEYNEIGERVMELRKSNDIIDALWVATLSDSLVQFEFDFPKYFDLEQEKIDDEENPVYFEGQKVNFN